MQPSSPSKKKRPGSPEQPIQPGRVSERNDIFCTLVPTCKSKGRAPVDFISRLSQFVRA